MVNLQNILSLTNENKTIIQSSGGCDGCDSWPRRGERGVYSGGGGGGGPMRLRRSRSEISKSFELRGGKSSPHDYTSREISYLLGFSSGMISGWPPHFCWAVMR